MAMIVASKGCDQGPDTIQKKMHEVVDCKVEGGLGNGRDDARSAGILNWIMARTGEGATWEAESRHAGALIQDLGVQSETELLTPCAKKKHDEGDEKK